MKKIVKTAAAPEPLGPYNQAVFAGDTLFVSGTIGINPASGKIEATNIQDETRQIFRNLEAILKEAGLEFLNVVKASIFLMDMNDFHKVNEVYASVFVKDFPARETVQVSKLPGGANVEISIIAHKF